MLFKLLHSHGLHPNPNISPRHTSMSKGKENVCRAYRPKGKSGTKSFPSLNFFLCLSPCFMFLKSALLLLPMTLGPNTLRNRSTVYFSACKLLQNSLRASPLLHTFLLLFSIISHHFLLFFYYLFIFSKALTFIAFIADPLLLSACHLTLKIPS